MRVEIPSESISNIPRGLTFPKSTGLVIAYPTFAPIGTLVVTNVIVTESPSFTDGDDDSNE